jgi:two-component system cell cycle sensor histidine kinase/response regulator CckA
MNKSNKKILVMDDEEIIREVIGEMLRHCGYEADFAGDGVEAIEKYSLAMKSDTPFDAVIMDLTIPGGLGGIETIKRLREIDPAVRAIVSSGYSHDPVMSNFREYGFAGIILKPYRISELNEQLRIILSA